jgi:hypothetical protein
MALYDITNGEVSPTAAGPVAGTLDTSALTGDFAIRVRVTGLNAGEWATIAVQDTRSATAFSDAIPVAVMHIQGEVQPGSERTYAWRRQQVPNTRFGGANAKLRVTVLAISSASAGLKLQASLDQ